MRYEIIDKYYLGDLYHVISDIENQVLDCVEREKLLGQEDDIGMLVPALMRSISLLRQIILLCENGFPDGALILARNVYEQRMLCAYVEEQDDKESHDIILEKYFQDSEMTRLKFMKQQAELFENEKETEKCDSLLRCYKEEHGISSGKNYWWSGKRDFYSMCEELLTDDAELRGLNRNMHMQYKLACIEIHPSCFSNKMNIGSNVHGIDLRARSTGQENALFLAVASLITLVGYTYHFLGLDSQYVLTELNRLGICYLELLLQQCKGMEE